MTRKMDSISLEKIGKFDQRKEIVIAIPKKNKMGNLIAGKLLEECTLPFKAKERGGLIPTSNPNFKVLEIPSSDIPLYVNGGVCELGICGRDMVAEARMREFLLKVLEIGKLVRVSIVAGREMDGVQLDWLEGKRIGTTFPNLTADFLQNKGISAQIMRLGGSVEQAWLEGLVDAGTDQVETGNSLKKAGMVEIAEIMVSQYCMWANYAAYGLKRALIDPLVTIMNGVLSAKREYILNGGDESRLKERGKKLLKFNVPPKKGSESRMR